MRTHSARRACLVLLLALATACSDASATAPVTIESVAGSYQLVSISWGSGEPFATLPTWTFPGRVLVIDGEMTLSVAGELRLRDSSRVTVFGDTTYASTAASGTWALRSDTILLMLDPRNAPTPALLAGRELTTYTGGFGSGGTRMRYRRR